KRLGNTRSVCRRAYVHPAVVDSYLDGSLDGQLAGSAVESAVLSLLRRRLGKEVHRRQRAA
ncbi:MAG: DNA topoisomerase IB, partial [Chloroflexi bacterium]